MVFSALCDFRQFVIFKFSVREEHFLSTKGFLWVFIRTVMFDFTQKRLEHILKPLH